MGLGDAVSLVAGPIAAASDAIAGTGLSRCLSCGDRHVALNEKVPDLLKPFRRRQR